MFNMEDKIKKLGKIFTPANIVDDMLTVLDYTGEKIIEKHILDNSCGEGAFLIQIVERYIIEYKKKFGNYQNIEKFLQKHIHGIEINVDSYRICINNLNSLIIAKGIKTINWNIINEDALQVCKFDKKMDYVIGNPPYVRIHNLLNINRVRSYNFAKKGMTDLFLVFYEIGFNQLKNNGKLVYITPNSFYFSNAGKMFRDYIIKNENLYEIINLGHYQPFKSITTYTTICAFDKSKKFKEFKYSKYLFDKTIEFQEYLSIRDAFNNGKMILAKKREQEFIKEISNYKTSKEIHIEVKNGFATLADSVFINDKFDFDSDMIIDVIKASTGEVKKCIFPYNIQDGKSFSFNNLDISLQDYLKQRKDHLTDRSIKDKNMWHLFGRSQGICDINKSKYTINTLIKNKNSIRIRLAKKGMGVYSGLYIITTESIKTIKKLLINDEFVNYVRLLGKEKRDGYYSISSYDLKQYLYYKLGEINE